jgi:OOP family OmpA-OmpF porin
MLLRSVFVLVALSQVWMLRPVLAQEEEYKDTPYLSGMPSYEISYGEDREFDSSQFFDGKAVVPVEGQYWTRTYSLREGARKASDLQILRNYANAIRQAGGTVFLEGLCEGPQCGDWDGISAVCGKLTKGNNEVWAIVLPADEGAWYTINVVERQAMRQDVTASVMLDALNRDGFVALHIQFDVNKAEIKPESMPTVEEIAVLLRDNPGLKVSIEGHTDNTGDAQKNKVLSEQRARSVMSALVKLGIEAARMKAVGWGQEAPVADNRTEEGRAKNRRVEIVKQ